MLNVLSFLSFLYYIFIPHSIITFILYVYQACIFKLFQDPIEQAQIDNFMVQQLDGTQNEWGWCKQKVNCSIKSLLFYFFPLVFNNSLFWFHVIASAWRQRHIGCITCCMQSRCKCEENSTLSGW